MPSWLYSDVQIWQQSSVSFCGSLTSTGEHTNVMSTTGQIEDGGNAGFIAKIDIQIGSIT